MKAKALIVIICLFQILSGRAQLHTFKNLSYKDGLNLGTINCIEQSEDGYKNFTVIKCKIKSIEWLYLAAKGHRRAKFDLVNKKESWLVP